MSLNQILDDIQDGATNLQVSTENVSVTNQKESTFKVPSSSLNKSVLDKFNVLYTALTAKNTIYPLNKVDYKIAQEVFTMLPEIDKVEQAKVTSYPSAINKNIVETALQNVSDTMPEEILEVFRDISNQITANADAINNVVDGVEVYAVVCQQAIERFTANRPLVIVDKESVDLFTEDLFRCSYIDDTQLDYEKYANKLSAMYTALVQDPTLSTYVNYRSNPEEGAVIPRYPQLSLQQVCDKIVHLRDVLKSERDHLSNYLGSLDMAIKEEVKAITANSTYLVNNANGVIEGLGFFKMLHDILEMEDQFFEKTKNLIEFLD